MSLLRPIIIEQDPVAKAQALAFTAEQYIELNKPSHVPALLHEATRLTASSNTHGLVESMPRNIVLSTIEGLYKKHL
ncbi:MAG: hypothetical protein AAGA75_15255 [Cyanobacteria bacterium P01_E01_bin.6]